MPRVYGAADIFTYPTVPWESFGIVLVEAMASGLPVVATDDPIRREIVGDAGLFDDPLNTKVYAKALRKALAKDWGDKPRKQAEKFSWDKIADQYHKLFDELK
jgi:glycosyltransferase involved in cell wall biosynthesis